MTGKTLNASLRSLRSFVRSKQVPCSGRRRNTSNASMRVSIEDWTNAFVSYDETAINREGTSLGPLRDLTFAVKDNICTKHFRTTCSSALLKEFTSPYDATVVRLLYEAGARIVGKTNCDEFGMGSYNIHSIHGAVMNPYRPESSHALSSAEERRSAGGSSGGSAAAVASGSCFAALGTDTGGSVRLPAAYCGIAGLKPSYGLISRWGVVSYADSLDCVGILAKQAKDIQPIFKVLSVHDTKDPSSANEDVRARLPDLRSEDDPLKNLTIGIPREYFPEELDKSTYASLRNMITSLKSAGARVVNVSLPSTRYALSTYYVIASAEASSNLAKYSGIHYGSRVAPPSEADRKRVSDVYSYTRSKGFGREVQKRILLGTYALSADAFDNYFLQAQRVRNMVKADFNRVFRSPNPLSPGRHSINHDRDVSQAVDLLLHPSAVGPAPLLAETGKLNMLEAYVQDVLTVPASLAGLPALSVPAGLAQDGWPLGVSIVGQWGHDELVLRVGEAIEQFGKI